MFKPDIAKLVAKETGLDDIDLVKLIEIPPTNDLGDYALPCFTLAKQMRKNPQIIADDLVKKLNNELFEKIESKSGYLNFFINKNYFVKHVLNKVLNEKQDYAKSDFGKNKTIVMDLSSPNIAKPFGIGHLRSTIIGNSIANISKKMGFSVVKINYLGDWGTQFGKLIVGYKLYGDEKELEKDPIKHLFDIYVKVSNNESLQDDARKAFKELEDGNKEYLVLWKRFRDVSLVEFNKIYKILDVQFDEMSGESVYNGKMDKTIDELKQKGLLKESDGALIVDLNKYNLNVAIIQKSDGATLYITRDITAAIDRYNKYHFSRMFYDVGQEQQHQFNQLFKVLELMGYDFAKNCVHVSHGLYLDADGKKFATRKGKTIFMSDILNETIDLARKTIDEKNPTLKDKDNVARKIAVASIFYGDLKNNRINDIVFDIDKFVEFQGDTGPYLLYSYVRATSIINKYMEQDIEQNKDFGIKENNAEIDLATFNLIKTISLYPDVVERAYNGLAPNVVANYCSELAQAFNEFYHSTQIIGNKDEKLMINVVESFRIVMKDALSLLGIKTTDEM